MRPLEKRLYQKIGALPEKLDTPVDVVSMSVEGNSSYGRRTGANNAVKKWIKRGVVFTAMFIIGLQAYNYFWVQADNVLSFTNKYHEVISYFSGGDSQTESVPYKGENINVDFEVGSKSHLLFTTNFFTENLHIKLIIPNGYDMRSDLGHVEADLTVKDKEMADKISIRVDKTKRDHFSWQLEHVDHAAKVPVNGTIYITFPRDLKSIHSLKIYFMDATVSSVASLASLRVKGRFEVGGGRGTIDVHEIAARKAVLRLSMGSLKASFRGHGNGKLHTVVENGAADLQILPPLPSFEPDSEDIEERPSRVVVRAEAINGTVRVNVKDPTYSGNFKAISVNGKANVAGNGLEFDVYTKCRQIGRRNIEKYEPARYTLNTKNISHTKRSSVVATTTNGNVEILFP